MLFWKKRKTPRYITTTLPYVNADPHIGFATEIIAADALARYWRLTGHDVFFNTGTDEHGQKIFEAAKKAEQDVQAYTDHFAAEFRKLKEVLNLSNDAFIRTTDDNHLQAAQEMWQRCEKNGDIYKKEFEGLYCVGCEKFLTERDMVDGKCAIHGKEPVLLKEENYFFKFSKYQNDLLAYLNRPGVIVPEWRRQEAIEFVKGGLEDFSISREKEKLSWGIPVPGDDTQVMYVWFDALTNYISTLGWPQDRKGNFKKFWKDGETLQMAGKDQVRFQSLMWQAMLISAGVENTDKVVYHGFINSGGQKMSKSIGNVISPYQLVEKYGTEATRYLLLRHVHPFEDTDITWDRLDEWYTANLANGLGNLASRIMKMAEDNLKAGFTTPLTFKEVVQNSDRVAMNVAVGSLILNYKDDFDQFQFHNVLDFVWGKIQMLDRKITETEPFRLLKSDSTREQGVGIIQELVHGLCEIAQLLQPIMPNTSELILKAIKENKKPETLFARLDIKALERS